MLRSVRSPGYIDCIFVRNLNPASIVIREARIREVVLGRRGLRGGLREGGEALEEGQQKGCELVGHEHRGLCLNDTL